MPCHDERQFDSYFSQYSQARAMLCAVLTVLNKNGTLVSVIEMIDWEEAGVSRSQFEAAWIAHQKEDAQRREREELKKREIELKLGAMKKLTPEEIRALRLDQ